MGRRRPSLTFPATRRPKWTSERAAWISRRSSRKNRRSRLSARFGWSWSARRDWFAATASNRGIPARVAPERGAGGGALRRMGRSAPLVSGRSRVSSAVAVQNVHVMRPDVRAEYERLGRPLDGDDAFHIRLARVFTELRDPLRTLYGDDPRLEPALQGLLEAMARTSAERTPALKALDHEREITPDWLQREQALGYVAYADRFAGTLTGVRERLPYLRELGVSYLHLMPLLRTRPEPN